MSKKNAWIVESEKTVVTTPVMSVVAQKCRSSETGRQFDFYLMRSRDWCNVVPVTEDGKLVLVRQPRIGTGRESLEFPGGVCDAADPDFEAAALRELAEETGYHPLPGARVTALGWVHPNPALQDNRCHLFIAGPVRRSGAQNLDPGEMIEVLEVPISELPGLIQRRELNHALMLDAFLLLLLRDPQALAALDRQLRGFVRS